MAGIIELLVRVIIILLVTVGIGYLVTRENRNKKPDNLVHYPKFYLIVSFVVLIFLTGLMGALILWGSGTTDEKLDMYFAIFFLIIPFIIFVAYFNWKIVLNEDTFTIRTFFRRNHTFDYKSAWIRYKSDNIIIVKGGKKTFFIDPNAIGIERFINKIKKNKKPTFS